MDTHGEFRRLADLRAHLAGDGPGLPVGVGDDAAVLDVGGGSVVACLDVLVQDVHFRLDISSPADVGWKAVAVNVSDIAAMGGVPLAVLVGLQRPADLSEQAIREMYTGMAEAGERWGVRIIGGDTVTAPVWSVAVTALGAPGAATVRRDGARSGDRVVLVGQLGLASAALHVLGAGGTVASALLEAHRRPIALPASGQALAGAGATAMIDISDGVGADGGHVASASGVDLHLDWEAIELLVPEEVRAAVPAELLTKLVLGGGEDFALLATVPSSSVGAVEAALVAAGEAPWSWVGEVVDGDVGGVGGGGGGVDAVWLAGDGAIRRIDHLGFDHG